MGFFKDLHTLKKQGDEIRRNTDVGALMAQNMAALQGMNDVMQSQVANAHLAHSGVDATATVSAVRQTGGFVNMAPVVQIDLLVHRGAPIPVTHQEAVPHAHLARLVPGATIPVKVDAADARRLVIDWYRSV